MCLRGERLRGERHRGRKHFLLGGLLALLRFLLSLLIALATATTLCSELTGGGFALCSSSAIYMRRELSARGSGLCGRRGNGMYSDAERSCRSRCDGGARGLPAFLARGWL